MSTRATRVTSGRGGSRQRKNELDLNSVPPGTSRNQDGPEVQVLPQVVQPSLPPLVIDVDAIDDDVAISSPRAIAEVENNSIRSRRRPVVDLDSVATPEFFGARRKRRRAESNQTIINCDLYINLENNTNSNVKKELAKQPSPPPPPPPPPMQPTFACPICLNSFDEEMSTKCGHIFCNKCIQVALSKQGKCPTCRRKVTAKELIRVFLPTSS